MKKGKSIKIGYLDVPNEYFEMDNDGKELICNKIIDNLLTQLDRNLPKEMNRIDFLTSVLESSLQTNVEEEAYEVASVIRDCIKILNED